MRRIARLRQPRNLRYLQYTPSATPVSATLKCAARCSESCLSSGPSSAQTATREARLFGFSRSYSTDVGSRKFEAEPEKSSLPVSLIEDQETTSDIEASPEPASPIFIIPPKETRAERSDEISDPSYAPSTTVEGLKSVGVARRWWEDRGHWDRSGDFVSFKARSKVQDSAVLTTVVRRAVMEALVLQNSGRQSELVGFWPVGGKSALDRVLALDVDVESGIATLNGDTASVGEDIRWKDEAADEKSAAMLDMQIDESGNQVMPMPEASDARDHVNSWHAAWTRISLAEPQLKFAVMKRILQLTGQQISDHNLHGISDVSSLLNVLLKPEPAKTVSREIQEQKPHLLQLSNVSFSPKRVTKGDKDKALGRFKLIERELAARDLLQDPQSIPRSREREYLRGKA